MAGWSFNPYAVGPLACFAASVLVIALIVTKRAPDSRRRATFAPLAAIAGSWGLGVALIMCSADDNLALLVARIVISGLFISGAFGISFVTDFARTRRRRIWILAAAAVCLIGPAMVWLDPQTVSSVRTPWWGGRYPQAGPRFLLAAAPTFAVLTTAAALSLAVFRKTPPSRRRRQAAYIFLSFVAALLGSLDLPALYGADLMPIGWATSLLSIVLVFYAIVRWRLMDVRTALHRSLFFVLIMAATFLPLYALTRSTAGWEGWSAVWPRTIVIVLALALLRAYAALAEAGIRRLLDGRRRFHARAVEWFAAAAVGARKPAALLEPLGEALDQIAGLRLITMDPLAADARALPAEPVARAELDPDQPADANALALLDAHGADVLLPMRHGDQLVGAIFAAARARALDGAELEALGRLAARAAVAFTNAALFDDLERRSTGLSVEVEERTQELAHAIEDLKSAQASLVQAEKQSALGLLVAGVSHEINNALNFIYGNLPTLQKYLKTYDDLAERAAGAGVTLPAELAARDQAGRAALPAAIEGVGEASRRARQIVDDLRRFARHDEAERKSADLREGLDSTVNLLVAELAGRVTVRRLYDADLPVIDCFPGALNHVFLNVVLNAAQAIQQAGTLSITARSRGSSVEITVSDDGVGLGEEAARRAFEAFYTTRRRAAGLGLTVSRQIVERHGGTIAIAPNPAGRGTTVTISLPRGIVTPAAEGGGRTG